MTQEFKGTKGKWYHDKDTLSIWHPNIIGKRLLCVDSFGFEITIEEKANALLIAHAPEMLEFIKAHYKYLNLDDQKKAEEIITKVTTL